MNYPGKVIFIGEKLNIIKNKENIFEIKETWYLVGLCYTAIILIIGIYIGFKIGIGVN